MLCIGSFEEYMDLFCIYFYLYLWVETQVNSEIGQINVTHVMTYFASGGRRGCRWWWGSSVAIHAFFIRSRSSRRMIRVRVSRWKLSFLFSILFKSLKATKVQGMMLTMVVTCTQSYISQVHNKSNENIQILWAFHPIFCFLFWLMKLPETKIDCLICCTMFSVGKARQAGQKWKIVIIKKNC